MPFKVTQHWSVGTTNATTPSASPLGVTFKYSRSLFRIRLFHTLKSMRPSPSMCCPSNSQSKVSLFGDGISLRILSHFLHVASMGSESCDSTQSTTCIGASLKTCLLPAPFVLLKASLAWASHLLEAPITAPSIRDFTVLWSCRMGTWLNASATLFSDPFWYSSSNSKEANAPTQ